jgi:hypothetical protein
LVLGKLGQVVIVQAIRKVRAALDLERLNKPELASRKEADARRIGLDLFPSQPAVIVINRRRTDHERI